MGRSGQWRAFLDKSRLAAPAFADTDIALRGLVETPLAFARQEMDGVYENCKAD